MATKDPIAIVQKTLKPLVQVEAEVAKTRCMFAFMRRTLIDSHNKSSTSLLRAASTVTRVLRPLLVVK